MKTMFINTGVGAVYTALNTALTSLSKKIETTVFSEKDDVAAMLFSTATEIPITSNIKNLKYIDGKAFKMLDLIVHGTEYSNGNGIDDINETLRIISESMPAAVVWTTDVSITKAKEKEALVNYMSALASLGYSTNYRVINAAQYGSAHHFTQLYVVSTKQTVDNQTFFEFPDPAGSPAFRKPLPEYLQDEPSTIYDIDYKHFALVLDEDVDQRYIIIRDDGKANGEVIAVPGDAVRWDLPTEKQTKRVKQREAPHLTPKPRHGVYWKVRYRFFTPYEYFKLQEFSTKDIESICGLSISDEKLYELAVTRSVNIRPATIVLYSLFKDVNLNF